MNETQIVALSIDKVQTFLTETIHAHVQERQTEEATLKNIVNASKDIADNFFTAIKEKFPTITTDDVLLACSGVYIFECALDTHVIEAKLNELFLEYYAASQGQKMLKGINFPKKSKTKIEAIQVAKKQLKQSKCMNTIIEANQDTLFSFCKVNEVKSCANKVEELPHFAQELNALYIKNETDNENRFRIAVIKADLDGMGDMFKNIDTDYEKYQCISNILYENISLHYLHACCKIVKPEENVAPWLFPFYIAGDDIFFAVSVFNLLDGIRVCQTLLSGVNHKITEGLSNIHKSFESKLSISIGVSITFNREPIRYYMQMVENELSTAKKANKLTHLKPFSRGKISIFHDVFYDVNYQDAKEYKASKCANKKGIKNELDTENIWEFFLHDISHVSNLKKSDKPIGTTNFFYTLLERLLKLDTRHPHEIHHDTDCLTYLNSVLYHLLPSNTENGFSHNEMLLYSGMIKQLMCYDDDKNKGMFIKINHDTIHRLEKYLRLLLLFSDPRFTLQDAAIKKEKTDQDAYTPELDTARKYLFVKTIDYMHKQLCYIDESLMKIFINKYKDDKIKAPIYQHLRIDKSMFIKLRNTKRIPRCKAADMLALQNTKHEEKDIAETTPDKDTIKTSVPRLYFDSAKFLQIANKENWTSTYIDSIMLVYEYRKLSAIYHRARKKAQGDKQYEKNKVQN